MSQVKRTALVLGANGLIGEFVVEVLLKNVQYETVYAVSRKGIDKHDDKLVQILADTSNIVEKLKDVAVDDFYACIGTTKAKTPDTNQYYKTDHDYPVEAAQLLKSNGCEQVCLVSSLGANPAAKNFYMKLKGDVEQSMIAVGMKNTFIFRPSLLIGSRSESRPLEALFQKITPIIDFLMVGSWKKFRSTRADIVAKSMVNVALSDKKGTHVFNPLQIKELA